jgi:hypothetical protein
MDPSPRPSAIIGAESGPPVGASAVPEPEIVSALCPACERISRRPAEETVGQRYFPCQGCGYSLDLWRHRVRRHQVKENMQEEDTGIRVRRRAVMGYRRIWRPSGSSAVHPELAGARMHAQVALWFDENGQAWEREGVRRIASGLLRPEALAVMALAILAGGVIAVRRLKMNYSPTVSAGAAPLDAEAKFDAALPAKFSSAAEATRAFLAADSVDEMLPMVRDRVRVEPAMRAWYAQAPPFVSPLRSVAEHSAVKARRNVFVRMVAETEDYRHTVVSLEEGPDGWLVDWESFVSWGEVHWPDLATSNDGTAAPALVRGWLSLTDAYEPPFSADGYQSCLLRSPDGGTLLSAWMLRDRGAIAALQGALHDAGTDRVEVILRLRPVPDGRGGRMEITEILQTGWILWKGANPNGKSLFVASAPTQKG